jgi:hypothetical protein
MILLLLDIFSRIIEDADPVGKNTPPRDTSNKHQRQTPATQGAIASATKENIRRRRQKFAPKRHQRQTPAAKAAIASTTTEKIRRRRKQ